MLSCKEITRLVSESLDRPLPLRQRVAVRLHILFCKLCDRYRRHLFFIRDALRRHPERLEGHEGPSSRLLSPEARERIKHRLSRNQ